ncbi:hypothetical protein AcW1_007794 [Taiwanofungus camphoratus]|nr:hypothetical protein AcW1_007794 [Antrodia cinnamomea]
MCGRRMARRAQHTAFVARQAAALRAPEAPLALRDAHGSRSMGSSEAHLRSGRGGDESVRTSYGVIDEQRT